MSEKILNMTLENIMSDRFGRYSKFIIQERALPDARDGLKPVQRRILYSMFKDGNTSEKAYRKSAKTVGNVLGNYHPHGDSSVYDAMVRMSQNFKMNHLLIDMQGNNGSIDGDSAAAMRYTEARMSKLVNELVRDIDKDTVVFAPNYDDTTLEPTVLPARYPNMLVNGASGISAGYATDIPPHNLEEIIDATIKRIDSPNCRLDTILEIVKGPDFPTGGIVQGKSGIRKALETGKGKVNVRSKITEEKLKGGRIQFVITEIPYEVNKANLCKRMDEIRFDKKIEGISEVRDESDRNGMRIVIELKKDAHKDNVINYLLKNTDLQRNYNYNMVSIINKRPLQKGIIGLLDTYIDHQISVVTRKSNYMLHKLSKRVHIVEGLIKALSILDEVIKTIRASKDKRDAKDNLVTSFNFTVEQAEAIVILQLYRLTNTDVTLLIEEQGELEAEIKTLKEILASDKLLRNEVKKDLRDIKNTYRVPRKSKIEDEISEIVIDEEAMIVKEDVAIAITKKGYVKRSSIRSYNSSNGQPPGVKDEDYIIGKCLANTKQILLLFTNLGHYLYIPINELPELKWKDLGKHVSNLRSTKQGEYLIYFDIVDDFNQVSNYALFTKNGLAKRTLLHDYVSLRYSKPITCARLKNDDEVVSVFKCNGDEDIVLTSKNGFALRYNLDEVSLIGLKAAGVKSMNLKEDFVVDASIIDSKVDYLILSSEQGRLMRIKLDAIPKLTRAKKGSKLIKDFKNNPNVINFASTLARKASVIIDGELVTVSNIKLCQVNSTGQLYSKDSIDVIYEDVELIEYKTQPKKSNPKKVEKKALEPKEIILDVVEVEEIKVAKSEDIVIEDNDENVQLELAIDDFLDDL